MQLELSRSVEETPLVPDEAPLAMPVQDLRRLPPAEAGPPPESARGLPGRVALARLVAFGGAALAGVLGCQQMLAAFGDDPAPLQIALLVLFTPTFMWVAFSFTGLLAGLLAARPVMPDGPNEARLAVVMPVYHEDASASFGALVALAQELAEMGLGSRTEIFVLSDSRRAEAVLSEHRALIAARALSPLPIWYRRRAQNSAHKSGNVADFLRRWGGRYDQMVVLDADSVMAGQTVATLSARMSADPSVGLIQTMPVLIGGHTILARVTQFAGRVYGPLIARGVSAWSGDNGNYWGHNAIIRVGAFAACCGLPLLPGRPPFGGPVLSHDFVEAALMRRAGWAVRLDHDLRGSYEGSPPTLADIAKRERRWAQGNLQHLRLIGAKGFTATSRAHFAIGVLGFLMSPVWLAMILVGLALTGWVLLSTPDYFPATYQLFPKWPIFDSRRMLWLFGAAMALLLLPKLIATLRAWYRPLSRQAGGRARILLSALFETLLSALIAPVQMLIQTRQIFDILRGRDSGWEAQVRSGSMPGWGVVWRRHAMHVLFGLAILCVLMAMSPPQLIWLSPILAGLILAPVTSRYSASGVWGRWARMRGLLITPEERAPSPIITSAAAMARRLPRPASLPRALAGLVADPHALAAYLRLIEPVGAPFPPAQRLPRISAGAKIAHASSRAEALEFLDAAEQLALVTDPSLLKDWSQLTQ